MGSCCKRGSKNFQKIDESLDILKAVSEPNRLRILCTLSKIDICVCDLAKKLEVSHNLISFHLKILYEAGILDKRRDGNQFFYFIKKEWKKKIDHFFSFININ